MKNYITRRKAKRLIADPVGLPLSNDEKLNDLVEDARQLMYSMYAEADIIPHIVRYISIEKFWERGNDCSYRGFSLPADMETMEGTRFENPNTPINLVSSWRVWGFNKDNLGCLELEDVEGYFPTERDIEGKDGCDHLSFFAEKREDEGGLVYIEYQTQNYGVIKEQLEIGKNGVRTTHKVVFINKLVTAEDRCGSIYVQEASTSRILSRYGRSEIVPSYRRYRFTAYVSGCDWVLIRASRRMLPLESDDDLVETDNVVAIKLLAQAAKLMNQNNPTQSDVKKSAQKLTQATGMLVGDKQRHRGKRTTGTLHRPRTINAYGGKLRARRGYRR